MKNIIANGHISNAGITEIQIDYILIPGVPQGTTEQVASAHVQAGHTTD